jgi:hypothetical protein
LIGSVVIQGSLETPQGQKLAFGSSILKMGLMEIVKDALMSYNILGYIIVLLMIVLVMKFLKNAGKSLVILIVVLLLFFALAKFFPEVITSFSDFIRGSWLGEE